jgi:autotransporter-associated beta strand protein
VGTGTVNTPRAVVVRPDQAFAYVTVAGEGSDVIKVIDTKTLAIDETFTIATGADPLGAALSPDGSRLYVGSETANALSVFSIDAVSGQLAALAAIATPGGSPERVVVSPDGSRVYAAVSVADAVYIIDADTLALDSLHPFVAVGAAPAGLAVEPGGARVYVGSAGSNHLSIIDTTTFAVTTLDIGARSAAIAIGPDGDRFYAAMDDSNAIVRFDPTGGTPVVLQTVAAGVTPVGLAMNAAGTALYAVNAGSDEVSIFVIASETGELVAAAPASIPAGGGPFLPGVATNGDALLTGGGTFVANRGGALATAGDDGVEFDGGTLLVNGEGLVFRTPISLGAGGGRVDTNGNDATLLATIGGGGAFTKTGAGTLTLAGGNTFGGGTTVSGGTLVLGATDALGTGGVTIDAGATLELGGFAQTFTDGTLRVNGELSGGDVTIDGATLAGSGTIDGDVTLSSGTISPGNSIGTLEVDGDFTWTAGTMLTFELGLGGASDRLAIDGVLRKSGVGAFAFDFGGTGAEGTYTLMTFASQSGFSAADFSAVNLGGGLTGEFVLSGTQLQFVASAPPPEDIEATVTLSNLVQSYDGTAKQATVRTSPTGLAVVVTYNGSATRPIAAGSYAVRAHVIEPGYEGRVDGTFTIVPAVATPPGNVAAAVGGAAVFTVAANGGGTALTYQWRRNGVDLPGENAATLTLNNVQPGDVGFYSVAITGGSAMTETVGVPLELAFDGQRAGEGVDAGADIRHPNGNVYDQVLLTGRAVSVKADTEQMVRVSYEDLSDDIVQVEFSGAGVMTLSLADSGGPAEAVNYVQPEVRYMKGHASVTITGADETTNLTVFSVGRITAVRQELFRDGVDYDGVADLAFVGVAATEGKFGGLRTGNVSYVDTVGRTGVYAPGVAFAGPVYVGDIHAADDARGVLVAEAVADARITGGDLWQPNAAPVEVDGLTTLRFTAGETSHGEGQPAQANRAVLMRHGADVTDDLVEAD